MFRRMSLALPLALVPLDAIADPVTLIKCTPSSMFARKCKVLNQELAKVISYSGLAYETDYNVTYKFTCRGDRPGFGLSADAGHLNQKIPNAQAGLQSSRISGSSDLWAFDPEPHITEGLNFYTPCEWTLHSVSRRPSEITARTWRTEEGIQIKLVQTTAFLVGVLQNFESYRTWDQTTTQTVLQSVIEKQKYLSSLCETTNDESACDSAFDFELVRKTLEVKIAYDPSQPAYRNVAQVYARILEQEESTLRAMAQRCLDWGVSE